jgi:hypothetical protein
VRFFLSGIFCPTIFFACFYFREKSSVKKTNATFFKALKKLVEEQHEQETQLQSVFANLVSKKMELMALFEAQRKGGEQREKGEGEGVGEGVGEGFGEGGGGDVPPVGEGMNVQ